MNSENKVTQNHVEYSEWLVPSVGSFVAAAIVLPSFYLVFLPINEAVGLWVGFVLVEVIWTAMLAASARITVSDGELRVSKAHISCKLLAEGREIGAEFRFAERGTTLDSRAFVHFQIGVKPLVRFENTDDRDPTPYWLLSSRNPQSLIAAVADSA